RCGPNRFHTFDAIASHYYSARRERGRATRGKRSVKRTRPAARHAAFSEPRRLARKRKRILGVRGRTLMRPMRQRRIPWISEHARERLTWSQFRVAAAVRVSEAVQLFQRRCRIISIAIVAADLRHFGDLYRPAQRVAARASVGEHLRERLGIIADAVL